MGKKLNDKIATILAEALSSMPLFYIIVFLVFIPLVWQKPDGPVGWAVFLSTVFFQAAALPVLGFVQKKESAKQMALIQETHDQVMAEISEVKAMHKTITLELQIIKEIHLCEPAKADNRG